MSWHALQKVVFINLIMFIFAVYSSERGYEEVPAGRAVIVPPPGRFPGYYVAGIGAIGGEQVGEKFFGEVGVPPNEDKDQLVVELQGLLTAANQEIERLRGELALAHHEARLARVTLHSRTEELRKKLQDSRELFTQELLRASETIQKEMKENERLRAELALYD